MLGWIVHYKNKYPGGRVSTSESAFDVYDAEGNHCVALRKDGAGMWQDRSSDLGCEHAHCLAPIPKDARVHKVIEGKVSFDDKSEERKLAREKFLDDGKIPSCFDLKKAGWDFDEKGRVVSEPKKQA